MNEYLSRQGFARMDTSEKLELMNILATRYDITFRTLRLLTDRGRAVPQVYSRKMDEGLSLFLVIRLLWDESDSL